MLALTPTATEVVNSIVSSQELPDTAGLRITSEESGTASNDSGDAQRDLRLSVVEQPQSGDEQIEGTPVYVESGATSELLDDKVLDAEVEGSEVRFSLMQQPEPPQG